MRYTNEMSEICINLVIAYNDAEIKLRMAKEAVKKAKEELDKLERTLTVRLATEGHDDFLTVNKKVPL